MTYVKVEICDAIRLPEIQSSSFKSGKILLQMLDTLYNFITNINNFFFFFVIIIIFWQGA